MMMKHKLQSKGQMGGRRDAGLFWWIDEQSHRCTEPWSNYVTRRRGGRGQRGSQGQGLGVELEGNRGGVGGWEPGWRGQRPARREEREGPGWGWRGLKEGAVRKARRGGKGTFCTLHSETCSLSRALLLLAPAPRPRATSFSPSGSSFPCSLSRLHFLSLSSFSLSSAHLSSLSLSFTFLVCSAVPSPPRLLVHACTPSLSVSYTRCDPPGLCWVSSTREVPLVGAWGG